jgi:SH3-like domain-containing protein
MWCWRSGVACTTTASAVLAASLAIAPPTLGQTYRIDNTDNAKRIHLRQSPTNKSRVIAYLPPDAQLSGTGRCDAKWCEVRFKDHTGWVFRRYLAEPRGRAVADKSQRAERTEVVAALPKTELPRSELPKSDDAGNGVLADLQDTMLRLAFTNGQPVPVYSFPSNRLPPAGHIPLDTPMVEDLSTCTREYCYIRSGSLVGWIPATAVAKEDAPVPPQPPAVTAKHETGAAQARALNNTVPTATQAPSQIGLIEGPGSIEVKSYSLAGLSDDASLPVREKPEENAAILGWIPGNAASVEGLRRCVLRWCLVRYEQLTGWIARRHLADEGTAATKRYQVSGVALWGALDVMDYPGPGAGIIGHIPSYATGIVPIGSCDKDWCHIRYLGIAGWVSAKYLAQQGR